MEIWALVISILSAIGTCIAAYLSFRANNPKIKVVINKENCIFTNKLNFLAFTVVFTNSAPVSGTISEIWIKWNGKYYCSKDANETFNTSCIAAVAIGRGAEIRNPILLDAPIVMLPFDYKNATIVFPQLSSTDTFIDCTVYFKIVGKHHVTSFKIRAHNVDYNYQNK